MTTYYKTTKLPLSFVAQIALQLRTAVGYCVRSAILDELIRVETRWHTEIERENTQKRSLLLPLFDGFRLSVRPRAGLSIGDGFVSSVGLLVAFTVATFVGRGVGADIA